MSLAMLQLQEAKKGCKGHPEEVAKGREQRAQQAAGWPGLEVTRHTQQCRRPGVAGPGWAGPVCQQSASHGSGSVNHL